MSKSSKLQKKTKAETSTCSSSCVASIAGLLEDHRASISADIKETFAAMESRLDKMQTEVTEHGTRLDSLENNAELNIQRIQALEEKCAALKESNARLTAKTADLESRSRRNNIRIIGLPESIEGPRPTSFFSDLLVELLGNDTLQTPPRTGPCAPGAHC